MAERDDREEKLSVVEGNISAKTKEKEALFCKKKRKKKKRGFIQERVEYQRILSNHHGNIMHFPQKF